MQQKRKKAAVRKAHLARQQASHEQAWPAPTHAQHLHIHSQNVLVMERLNGDDSRMALCAAGRSTFFSTKRLCHHVFTALWFVHAHDHSVQSTRIYMYLYEVPSHECPPHLQECPISAFADEFPFALRGMGRMRSTALWRGTHDAWHHEHDHGVSDLPFSVIQ